MNRIAIVDDHEMLRQMLIAILRKKVGMEIVFEGSNGNELVEYLASNHGKIDTILLDLEMPVLNGFDTLRILKQKYPEYKVIILSAHYNEYYLAKVIAGGADCYLPKHNSVSSLCNAIEKVHTDGFYFEKKVSKEALLDLVLNHDIQFLISEKVLSQREVSVLKEFGEGKSPKEIADTLCVSVETIRFHQKNIKRKTGSRSIVDLVKYAIKVGITNTNTPTLQNSPH